eukprot:s627_g41.t1
MSLPDFALRGQNTRHQNEQREDSPERDGLNPTGILAWHSQARRVQRGEEEGQEEERWQEEVNPATQQYWHLVPRLPSFRGHRRNLALAMALIVAVLGDNRAPRRRCSGMLLTQDPRFAMQRVGPQLRVLPGPPGAMAAVPPAVLPGAVAYPYAQCPQMAAQQAQQAAMRAAQQAMAQAATLAPGSLPMHRHQSPPMRAANSPAPMSPSLSRRSPPRTRTAHSPPPQAASQRKLQASSVTAPPGKAAWQRPSMAAPAGPPQAGMPCGHHSPPSPQAPQVVQRPARPAECLGF